MALCLGMPCASFGFGPPLAYFCPGKPIHLVDVSLGTAYKVLDQAGWVNKAEKFGWQGERRFSRRLPFGPQAGSINRLMSFLFHRCLLDSSF